MFALTRYETKVIMEGKASGCARKYDNCPHAVGAEIVLTSKFLDQSGRSIPFAKATVVSIRPGTVQQFKADPMIAEMDGYPNASVWAGQMRVMYGTLKDTDKITHIKFRITELDRDAGTRPDEGQEPVREKSSID